MPRNIIDVIDLSVEEIDELIATAEDIITNPVKYQDICAHKQLATLCLLYTSDAADEL